MAAQLAHEIVACPARSSPVEIERPQPELPERPQVILAEHRDLAFARLSADLARCGFAVLRARTGSAATALCHRRSPLFVLANVGLPDQTGWLLAAKLTCVRPRKRVWLYKPFLSPCDLSMAGFLGIDELLESSGPLIDLSAAMLVRIAERFGNPVALATARRCRKVCCPAA
jgi:hypothetical protein